MVPVKCLTVIATLIRERIHKCYSDNLFYCTGLHYGPYFRSPSGERERSQPVLYMRAPEVPRKSTNRPTQPGLVTPFDVHGTLLRLIGLHHNIMSQPFINLLKPVPLTRSCREAGVPLKHCLYDHGAERSVALPPPQTCQQMPLPPSLSSYYSDIPYQNRGRAQLIQCDAVGSRSAARASVFVQGVQQNLGLWSHSFLLLEPWAMESCNCATTTVPSQPCRNWKLSSTYPSRSLYPIGNVSVKGMLPLELKVSLFLAMPLLLGQVVLTVI